MSIGTVRGSTVSFKSRYDRGRRQVGSPLTDLANFSAEENLGNGSSWRIEGAGGRNAPSVTRPKPSPQCVPDAIDVGRLTRRTTDLTRLHGHRPEHCREHRERPRRGQLQGAVSPKRGCGISVHARWLSCDASGRDRALQERHPAPPGSRSGIAWPFRLPLHPRESRPGPAQSVRSPMATGSRSRGRRLRPGFCTR